MPRKPGVSKVRATAPRSISGSARSWGAAKRSPPSAASSGSSSRRLSQRIPNTIEWLFDDRKGIALWLAGSIQPRPARDGRAIGMKTGEVTKQERLDKDRLLRDSERV